MAKLLSHHDKFHVHAVLGLAALAHFLFRFLCFFFGVGDTFTKSWASGCTLGIHVLLHATSLQFELPRNRMYSKPMIWKEFRLHNMVFTYRHVIATALGIWAPDFWWRQVTPLSVLAKIALVLSVCKVADGITQRLGSEEKRTTNAMPYPEQTKENLEKMAKWFYAKSQLVATALAAFGPPFLAFGPILAIELASLLMTLVRKGLIGSQVYHSIYASALFVMGPAMIVGVYISDEASKMAVFRAMVACTIAVRLRMLMGVDKYLTWAAAILVTVFLVPCVTSVVRVEIVATLGAAWSLLDTLDVMRKEWNNAHLHGLMLEKAAQRNPAKEVSSD